MSQVNMLEAKTHLSRLVEAIESGAETEIIIARDGKPAARLIAIEPKKTGRRRLGTLAGRYPDMTLEDFNSDDELIAKMFNGELEPQTI